MSQYTPGQKELLKGYQVSAGLAPATPVDLSAEKQKLHETFEACQSGDNATLWQKPQPAETPKAQTVEIDYYKQCQSLGANDFGTISYD